MKVHIDRRFRLGLTATTDLERQFFKHFFDGHHETTAFPTMEGDGTPDGLIIDPVPKRNVPSMDPPEMRGNSEDYLSGKK